MKTKPIIPILIILLLFESCSTVSVPPGAELTLENSRGYHFLENNDTELLQKPRWVYEYKSNPEYELEVSEAKSQESAQRDLNEMVGDGILQYFYELILKDERTFYRCYALIKKTETSRDSMDSIQKKLKEGVSPDALLLAYAAEGRNQSVSFLLKNGANLNCRDNKGNTILHYAILLEDAELLDLLLSYPNLELNIVNKQSKTPVDLTLENHNKIFETALRERGGETRYEGWERGMRKRLKAGKLGGSFGFQSRTTLWTASSEKERINRATAEYIASFPEVYGSIDFKRNYSFTLGAGYANPASWFEEVNYSESGFCMGAGLQFRIPILDTATNEVRSDKEAKYRYRNPLFSLQTGFEATGLIVPDKGIAPVHLELNGGIRVSHLTADYVFVYPLYEQLHLIDGSSMDSIEHHALRLGFLYSF